MEANTLTSTYVLGLNIKFCMSQVLYIPVRDGII